MSSSLFPLSTPAGARTLDTLIKSQVLYQLSYGCILSRLRVQRYTLFPKPPNFFGKFFQKSCIYGIFTLLTRGMEALKVLITALHHALIDVSDPQRMQDDKGQTQQNHKNVSGCLACQCESSADDDTW